MPRTSTEPLATPLIPSGGLFSPYAEEEIEASASAIYDAIIDTSKYPEWNTFVPAITIEHQPNGDKDSPILAMGTVMNLHVTMSASMKTTSREVVSICEDRPKDTDPPGTITRVGWTLDHNPLVPRFMLNAERVNEIESRADGTCICRSFETFKGPYARLIKWSLESTLQARFEDWVRDLKKFVEGANAGTKTAEHVSH